MQLAGGGGGMRIIGKVIVMQHISITPPNGWQQRGGQHVSWMSQGRVHCVSQEVGFTQLLQRMKNGNPGPRTSTGCTPSVELVMREGTREMNVD